MIKAFVFIDGYCFHGGGTEEINYSVTDQRNENFCKQTNVPNINSSKGESDSCFFINF